MRVVGSIVALFLLAVGTWAYLQPVTIMHEPKPHHEPDDHRHGPSDDAMDEHEWMHDLFFQDSSTHRPRPAVSSGVQVNPHLEIGSF